jgi:hypothetical protein
MWRNRCLHCGASIYFSVQHSSLQPQVTVSNPAEVAKTRLQLQGELAKDGVKKVYSSAIDVLGKTWKNEGIRGLQRGLAPAVRISSLYKLICCMILCCSTHIK